MKATVKFGIGGRARMARGWPRAMVSRGAFSAPLGAKRVPLVFFCAFSALALLGFLQLALPAGAQRGKPTEYQVEAVYLYQFGSFVMWPPRDNPQQTNSFSICVLGRDPFGRVLDETIAGESVGKTPLKAVRIAMPEDARACQILFISASESAQLGNILAALGKSPVLTVSDIPNFTASGGMVQFLVQDNRVRFEINLDGAAKAGLTLSSQLLKVAASVRRGSRPEAP